MPEKARPIPSACVIPLREGAAGPELLLVRRNPDASAFPGMWTFPGGHIDPEEYRGDADDEKAAARRAAARESREEAGMELDPGNLVFIARWTTPEIYTRRFRTWFFLAKTADHRVRTDGKEIVDHRWLPPQEVLSRQEEGGMEMPPPIFVLTTILSGFRKTSALLDHFGKAAPLVLTPKVAEVPGGLCLLYPRDAGYASVDPDAPGPRHRLWALKSGWRYVPPTGSR